MSQEGPSFQYTSLSSFIQTSFWNKLSEFKIDVDKLTETERAIWGFYSNVSSTWPTHIVEVDSTSFNTDFRTQTNCIPFCGKIYNKNNIEHFKNCDKTDLINKEGRRFLDSVKSGLALEKPSAVNAFFILSFMDLKKYHFYYWFGFPVPHNLKIACEGTEKITACFTDTQLANLSKEYLLLDLHQKPYFLIEKSTPHIVTLHSNLREITDKTFDGFFFAFADYFKNDILPKPQLKNYILLLLHYCPFLAGRTVQFLGFNLDKKLSCANSIIYKLNLPQVDPIIAYGSDADSVWTGWEKNEHNKFGPRFSNMKSSMDPEVLFENSVDLNLKLMKWRLLPDINLEVIKETKYLLLGAGTLGCSVARTLLAWGARHITFMDNATVSFSNPVRQSLFTYEDSIKERPKAQAAADNLRKIFPGVKTCGYQLTIPMPGHTVGDNMLDTVLTSVEKLQDLIKECDVVYLLTDSRESRWLPTLLGIFYEKIVINVALGFDTYLVMRYGGQRGGGVSERSNTPSGYKSIPGNQLGCYFCNDVTAPGNSLKDRSLDQQCTVIRPGVSSIAGALAVELTIALLQHEDGIKAPAYYQSNQTPEDPMMMHEAIANQSILGMLPHSIRGFLTNFTHVLPATPKYNQCIACSSKILESYRDAGFQFLHNAFNSSKYLEDLTGLTELHNQQNFIDVIALSEDEDFEA